MLLYFYFISFILCIECTISYNYIEDSLRSNVYNSGRHVKKARKTSRGKNRNVSIRKEYDYDRSPVEFDVASFIQPEYDSMEGDEAYKRRNKSSFRRQSISKSLDFGSIVGLNADVSSNMKDTDLIQSIPELSDNPMPLKDTMKSKHMLNGFNKTNAKFTNDKHNMQNTKMSLNEYLVHSPEKKCIFRHMKLPFFSHNKTEPGVKKNKKRKLICFNCPNNKDSEKSTTSIIQYKIKRSYMEKLCPSCKKKYTADLPSENRKKKRPKHSNNTNNNKQSRKKQRSKLKTEQNTQDLYENVRNKREETTREQYLKELEQVQRKIDNVPVTMPKFEKNSHGLQY